MKFRPILVLTCTVFLILFQDARAAESLKAQAEIHVGVVVEVTTSGQNLNLRASPDLDAAIVAKLPPGTLMSVIGGPQSADGYIWWELSGEPGRGWAAANFLSVVQGETSESISPAAPPIPGAECQPQEYAGIRYCTRDGGQTHLVFIDLNDPHVAIRAVMANNNTNVNMYSDQWISEMVEPFVEAGAGVVAAINGDYFGAGHHGPEGFTTVNGVRLDGGLNGDGDSNAIYRSSLTFGPSAIDGGLAPIPAEIRRFESDDIDVAALNIFTAIGGGPQVMFNGIWDWKRGMNQPGYADYPPCDPEKYASNDVINGECFYNTGDWDKKDKMWTAAVLTNDHRLVFVLTEHANITATLTLPELGAAQAIKLDGGASSQLWFDGDSPVPGGREVVNSLVVFYVRAFRILDPPQWPAIVEGDSLDLELVVQNIGADTWKTGETLLVSTVNPWGTRFEFNLPHDVAPQETVSFQWTTDPFTFQFVNKIELTLETNGETFPGPPVIIDVIVLPEALRERIEELQEQIKEWLAQGVENIEQLIVQWILKQLEEASDIICPPFALAVPMVVTVVRARRKNRNRGQR